MGENQYKKLETRDKGKRGRYLGAAYQTLKEPVIIIQQNRMKDGGRPSWLYVKSFVKDSSPEIVVSVIVSQFDNKMRKPIKVSISTHPMEMNPVLGAIKKPDAIVYERP